MRESFHGNLDKALKHIKNAAVWVKNKAKNTFKHVTTHPKGWLHFTIFIQLLVILGMVGWLVYGYIMAASFNTKPTMPEVAVEAEAVSTSTFEQFVNTAGTLRSNQTITIKPETDGKIQEIFVKSGQFVNKGDKIVQLNDRAYVAQLKEAEAKLKLDQAKHERAKNLMKRGAGKKTDREEAYARMLMSEAEVEK